MSEQSATTSGDGSAGGVTEQAKEKAQEVGGGAAAKVQETVRTQVDQRSTQAGEQISTVARELRGVGQHLREQEDEAGAASLAEQAADRVERAGGYLTESDADRILSDIEDLGRRQPWLALAGGVALGLVAARLLKASSSDRYRSRSTGNVSGDGAPSLGERSAPVAGAPPVPTTQRPAVPEPVTVGGGSPAAGI